MHYNSMNIKQKISVALILCFTSVAFGQKTQVYLDKDLLYKTGLELFDKRQYTAAQKSFMDFMQSNSENRVFSRIRRW